MIAAWPTELGFAEYARRTIAAIPPQYFKQHLPIYDGDRLELQNNRLIVVHGKGSGGNVIGYRKPLGGDSPVEVGNEIAVGRPPPQQRALNGFMSFRAYVAPLFAGITQATKSRATALLWENEPLKPQWELMALAYSIIRDNFEVTAKSLQLYMTLVTDIFLLPSDAETYLARRGWELRVEDNSIFFSKVSQCTVHLCPVSNVSIDDIIVDCIQNGWIVRKIPGSLWPAQNTWTDSALAVRRCRPVLKVADPFEWLFDDDDKFNKARFEYSLDEVYSEPDSDMDPLDDLVYDPDQAYANISNIAPQIISTPSVQDDEIFTLTPFRKFPRQSDDDLTECNSL
ncbi:Mating type protein [Penicillium macrosclerotiorum]|uniref:Mating type protein n=1 Tax=Penicillium macrosclerotiorum TaxID=303699 RepID=UPI002548A1B7|nr:Mating type protein [Penicillium macrosclerotiorum]KAJ5692160.1 Mating type protein [Penicillium macrosclerotiorum]